jgi:hypothetical protein
MPSASSHSGGEYVAIFGAAGHGWDQVIDSTNDRLARPMGSANDCNGCFFAHKDKASGFF